MLKPRNLTLAGLLIGLLMCAALGMMSRKIIDHVPLYDELLHVLSARSLLATGEPAIAGGLYERAELFTQMVAASFRYLGPTPLAARIPALLFAMGLAVLVSVWVTRRTGIFGGLIAGAVFCLLPTTIELAVFARFYTLHAFVVATLGILLYEASEPLRSLRFRAISAVVALALIAIGLHLQETTIIAVGAIGAGIAAVLARDHWTAVLGIWRRYPVRIVVVAVVGIAGFVAAAVLLGLVERLGEAPLWAMNSAHRPFYYLVTFAGNTPFLWPVFPVVCVIAFRAQPRLTLFCLTVLAVTVVVHSIAAQKSLRYIYYVMPFMCAVWGAAGAGIASAFASGSATRKPSAYVALVLVGIPLLLSVEGLRAVKLALGRLTPIEALGYAVEAEWSPAMTVLKPLATAADRIMTSNSMKSIYYLDRYDYELNASIVGETDTEQEFGRDERTGGQAIGTALSTQKVLAMPGTTLVVLEQETMSLDSGVPAAALAVITSNCNSVALPPAAELSAWTCSGH